MPENILFLSAVACIQEREEADAGVFAITGTHDQKHNDFTIPPSPDNYLQ